MQTKNVFSEFFYKKSSYKSKNREDSENAYNKKGARDSMNTKILDYIQQ